MLFLTPKMSAAEAVEMSVTNSLSQDYSNLDDLLSLTCTDSSGFKPFTLINISSYPAMDVLYPTFIPLFLAVLQSNKVYFNF